MIDPTVTPHLQDPTDLHNAQASCCPPATEVVDGCPAVLPKDLCRQPLTLLLGRESHHIQVRPPYEPPVTL